MFKYVIIVIKNMYLYYVVVVFIVDWYSVIVCKMNLNYIVVIVIR